MATISVKHRKSINDNKKGTIYYQIIHNRVVRQIKTNYKVSNLEWKFIEKGILSKIENEKNLSLISEKIKKDIARLKGIIKILEKKYGHYSTFDIIRLFVEYENTSSLYDFIYLEIIKLNKINKYRTAETYLSALNSIKKFRNNEELLLNEIDSDLMIMYEAYLESKGLKRNSISFYMRVLRSIYNKAIDKGLTYNSNPFKYVYTGIDKTIKRAISLDMIKKIKDIDLYSDSSLDFARDMFMFSFYTRGMSFIDMSFLNYKNIVNGYIVYKRRKTGQQLIIKLEKCMYEIIEKYKNNGQYLFPIIQKEENERMQYKNSMSIINRNLKKIAIKAGIYNNLSMYVARHSWASCAKNKNIPISVISEGMGHDSEFTTQIYLASLDYGVIDKANKQIIRSL